jgi:Fe2+ or Zn2+ uptake regulation protein
MKQQIKQGVQRTTNQLDIVLQALDTLPCPVTIANIKSATGLIPSTIYRIIERLQNQGTVVAVANGNDVGYELIHHHHHRIHCVHCNKTVNLPECSMTQMIPSATLPSIGFSSISHHVLEFFGICEECVITSS